MRLSVLGFAVLFPVVVAAAEDRPAHFHVLTDKLTRRITRGKPSQLRHNLEAIGNYKQAEGHIGGTAYLVSKPDSTGHALMLTNHHVALYKDKSINGDQILFHPGGNTTKPLHAEVVAAVTHSLKYDYALLRVKLPPALRSLKPVRIAARHSFVYGERIYNPSFPRMQEGEAFTPKRLQVGYAEGFETDGLAQFFLPMKSGSSGSPLFSRNSHKLVAMMNAGGGEATAFVRPMKRILDDLARKKFRIANKNDRKAVEALLK